MKEVSSLHLVINPVKSLLPCPEDGIVRVIHIHHIESNIFCAGIVQAAKEYRERYGAHWLNSFFTKTI
jgi:hypothetical protein